MKYKKRGGFFQRIGRRFTVFFFMACSFLFSLWGVFTIVAKKSKKSKRTAQAILLHSFPGFAQSRLGRMILLLVVFSNGSSRTTTLEIFL